MSTEALIPDADEAREAALARFAARTLELDAVRELFVEHAVSSIGKRAIAELAPLDDEGVRAAYARLRELQMLERVKDPVSMGGVTDPQPLVDAAHERPLEEEELARLRQLLSSAERISDWLAARAPDVPALGRLGAELPELSDLRDRIDRLIDERGRVKESASPLLARMRNEERELGRRIDGVLRGLLGRADLRGSLMDTRVHLRGARPCLAVKARSSGRVPGIVHDHSQSEQTAFVEPQDVIELANRQVEVRIEAQRELTRLLLEATRDVLAAGERLELVGRLLGQLELALIGARFCEAYGARAPRLMGEEGASGGLLLRSARHPLLVAQARAGRLEEVVPIDLRLGEDFDMLIITGPNTGGKTVALKTAGLVALMVRLGLPVPCEDGSTVPLYEGVCADIGDEQEISQSLSTFSSHLVRIRSALERAGPDTLVLLDELGGGTDPDEGAALGEAILNELLNRGAPTLVSTHLGRLKEFAYRNARAENASTEFDLETLAPRYRVTVGIPGESAALVVARRFGLPPKLVERAEERLERRDEEVAALFEEVRDVRSEAERVRSQAETRLAEAEDARRELSGMRDELEQRGNLLEAEAQRGLEERIRLALAILARAERLLPQLPAQQRAEMESALADLRRALERASLTERREAFLEGLKKGVLVYLPKYRRRLPVHKVDHENRKVVVKLGSMKLDVAFDEVTEYESL